MREGREREGEKGERGTREGERVREREREREGRERGREREREREPIVVCFCLIYYNRWFVIRLETRFFFLYVPVQLFY